MRLIQQLTLDDVPHGFDEKQYVIDRPEAAAFQKTFCQLHKIPDRVRLYVHALTQKKSFDFVTVRALFLNNEYAACYQEVTNDLFRAINHPTYEPFGHWLVECANKLGKVDELVELLQPYAKIATAQKCLELLTGKSTTKLEHQCLVFYAFDANYTEAFKASVVSFVLANEALLPKVKLVIGNDPDVALSEINHFLSGLGVDYALVNMDQYASLALKESYGHDAAVKLNKSAYYRIFLIKQLTQDYRSTHRRALYLDADTLVLSSLEELLQEDMQQPLHATSEDQLQGLVRTAKAVNSLDNYFNSGVLLFDLQHEDLERLIDKTIETAMTKQHKLILQDQCALNVGFDGYVHSLSDQYNYMLHCKPLVQSHRHVSILHFTGRTKPWQKAYQDKTIFGEIWKSFYNAAVKPKEIRCS